MGIWFRVNVEVDLATCGLGFAGIRKTPTLSKQKSPNSKAKARFVGGPVTPLVVLHGVIVRRGFFWVRQSMSMPEDRGTVEKSREHSR